MMNTALTLPKLFEGFLLSKEADGIKPRTVEAYRLMFQTIIRHFPPDRDDQRRQGAIGRQPPSAQRPGGPPPQRAGGPRLTLAEALLSAKLSDDHKT
jgi:hypothetical protein